MQGYVLCALANNLEWMGIQHFAKSKTKMHTKLYNSIFENKGDMYAQK
jgi:hypothetical protein